MQLEEEVKSTAAYFRKMDITEGDRVLVFVPMGIDLYIIVLALFYIGATAVFLDEWVSKKRLVLCCQLADCKGFIGIFKARIIALFSKELRQIQVKLKLKKKLNEAVPIVHVQPDTAALITFTTGSTGTPKAVRRTHEFLKEQFDALLDEIEPKATDIDMPVLPIVLFVNLGMGCTSIIADFKMTKPESMNVSVIADQIKKGNVNRITASPFFIRKLAEHAIERNTEHPDIEKIFTGGAPVFPTEATLYLKAFPRSRSTIVYGSTEAEPISSINAEELVSRSNELDYGLPVGRPFHKARVKIIQIIEEVITPCSEEVLQNLFVKKGQIGEIIVSGPHVLTQYFKNEQAFRQNKIVVGETIWHRTGDSGFMKGDELFLTGRCKQLIRVGNECLSPFIIENQLQAIEGVTMGTLIKVRDQLVLMIQSALEAEQVEQYVKGIPYDKIKVVTQIPMDPRHNSKIDYEKLNHLLTQNKLH